MDPAEEPDLYKVIEFRNDSNNFPDENPLPRMTIERLAGIQDKIIRGWVYREEPKKSNFLSPHSEVNKHSEGVVNEQVPLINRHEQEYPGFEWYSSKKTYGVVFVKGHGLEKKLFFEWSPEVVFYCPFICTTVLSLASIKQDIVINQKPPMNNRFFGNMPFYYLDRKRKKWITFRFDQFNEISKLFKSVLQGTDNCGGNTITAINRLR